MFKLSRGGEVTAELGSKSSSLLRGKCTLGAFTYIGAGGEFTNVTIGRFCSIAKNVTIGATEHPTDWLSTHPFVYTKGIFKNIDIWDQITKPKKYKINSATTIIGNDVWIGARAIVRKGVTIGDGAIIGAGAIVLKDVPAYSIVGGVPAKIIRMRFNDEKISKLLKIRWWDYDLSSPHLNQVDYSDIDASILLIENLIGQKKIRLWQPQSTTHYFEAKV